VFSGISSHFRETSTKRCMGKAFVLRFALIAGGAQTAVGLQVS